MDIIDASGARVQQLPITDQTNPASESALTLLPGTQAELSSSWFTSIAIPGSYTVSLKLFDQFSNQLLAERTVPFTVQTTQQLALIRLTATPHFTIIGAQDQVQMNVDIVNTSNVEHTTTLRYELLNPQGTVIKSADKTLQLSPATTTQSFLLDEFPHLFDQSGEYPVTLTVTEGVTPDSVQSDIISVAPSVRLELQQGIAPDNVVPDGDKRITINIQLKGVEQK